MVGFEIFIGSSYALRIQVCPKKGISPTILFFSDGMFRPSILLDREGSGFLGMIDLPHKMLVKIVVDFNTSHQQCGFQIVEDVHPQN